MNKHLKCALKFPFVPLVFLYFFSMSLMFAVAFTVIICLSFTGCVDCDNALEAVGDFLLTPITWFQEL